MLQKPKCPVIAIEEHYWDPELVATYSGVESIKDPEIAKRITDFTDYRIQEMDAAGIDVQVLSHGAPSTQKLGPDVAVALTRRGKDRLPPTGSADPKRPAPFAA